jgi:hypothetical protein
MHTRDKSVPTQMLITFYDKVLTQYVRPVNSEIIPTSSSCRALEQEKVISSVSVSFCFGLDPTDSLDHQQRGEAENSNYSKSFNIFSDILVNAALFSIMFPCFKKDSNMAIAYLLLYLTPHTLTQRQNLQVLPTLCIFLCPPSSTS